MKEAIIYDVRDIYKQLYGAPPFTLPALPPVNLPGAPKFHVNKAAEKRTTFNGSSLYGSKDLIGREVFLPVTIQVDQTDYELPFSVVSMRRRKMIEETPMVEREGSVIELIGLENWQISLKGFLIDPLNQFPDQQLADLDKIFRKNSSVRLKCALTDIFLQGNDFVVIKELDIPDKAKVVGVREYSFSMVSNNILTLEAE